MNNVPSALRILRKVQTNQERHPSPWTNIGNANRLKAIQTQSRLFCQPKTTQTQTQRSDLLEGYDFVQNAQQPSLANGLGMEDFDLTELAEPPSANESQGDEYTLGMLLETAEHGDSSRLNLSDLDSSSGSTLEGNAGNGALFSDAYLQNLDRKGIALMQGHLSREDRAKIGDSKQHSYTCLQTEQQRDVANPVPKEATSFERYQGAADYERNKKASLACSDSNLKETSAIKSLERQDKTSNVDELKKNAALGNANMCTDTFKNAKSLEKFDESKKLISHEDNLPCPTAKNLETCRSSSKPVNSNQPVSQASEDQESSLTKTNIIAWKGNFDAASISGVTHEESPTKLPNEMKLHGNSHLQLTEENLNKLAGQFTGSLQSCSDSSFGDENLNLRNPDVPKAPKSCDAQFPKFKSLGKPVAINSTEDASNHCKVVNRGPATYKQSSGHRCGEQKRRAFAADVVHYLDALDSSEGSKTGRVIEGVSAGGLFHSGSMIPPQRSGKALSFSSWAGSFLSDPSVTSKNAVVASDCSGKSYPNTPSLRSRRQRKSDATKLYCVEEVLRQKQNSFNRTAKSVPMKISHQSQSSPLELSPLSSPNGSEGGKCPFFDSTAALKSLDEDFYKEAEDPSWFQDAGQTGLSQEESQGSACQHPECSSSGNQDKPVVQDEIPSFVGPEVSHEDLCKDGVDGPLPEPRHDSNSSGGDCNGINLLPCTAQQQKETRNKPDTTESAQEGKAPNSNFSSLNEDTGQIQPLIEQVPAFVGPEENRKSERSESVEQRLPVGNHSEISPDMIASNSRTEETNNDTKNALAEVAFECIKAKTYQLSFKDGHVTGEYLVESWKSFAPTDPSGLEERSATQPQEAMAMDEKDLISCSTAQKENGLSMPKTKQTQRLSGIWPSSLILERCKLTSETLPKIFRSVPHDWAESLHHLTVVENPLVTSLCAEVVVSMPTLRTLDLSKNRLTSLPELQCPQLESLNLQGNFLTSAKGIEALFQLRTLNLSSNNLENADALLMPLLPLTCLKNLVLEGNPVQKITRLRERVLEILPDLETLDLIPVQQGRRSWCEARSLTFGNVNFSPQGSGCSLQRSKPIGAPVRAVALPMLDLTLIDCNRPESVGLGPPLARVCTPQRGRSRERQNSFEFTPSMQRSADSARSCPSPRWNVKNYKWGRDLLSKRRLKRSESMSDLRKGGQKDLSSPESTLDQMIRTPQRRRAHSLDSLPKKETPISDRLKEISTPRRVYKLIDGKVQPANLKTHDSEDLKSKEISFSDVKRSLTCQKNSDTKGKQRQKSSKHIVEGSEPNVEPKEKVNTLGGFVGSDSSEHNAFVGGTKQLSQKTENEVEKANHKEFEEAQPSDPANENKESGSVDLGKETVASVLVLCDTKNTCKTTENHVGENGTANIDIGTQAKNTVDQRETEMCDADESQTDTLSKLKPNRVRQQLKQHSKRGTKKQQKQASVSKSTRRKSFKRRRRSSSKSPPKEETQREEVRDRKPISEQVLAEVKELKASRDHLLQQVEILGELLTHTILTVGAPAETFHEGSQPLLAEEGVLTAQDLPLASPVAQHSVAPITDISNPSGSQNLLGELNGTVSDTKNMDFSAKEQCLNISDEISSISDPSKEELPSTSDQEHLQGSDDNFTGSDGNDHNKTLATRSADISLLNLATLQVESPEDYFDVLMSPSNISPSAVAQCVSNCGSTHDVSAPTSDPSSTELLSPRNVKENNDASPSKEDVGRDTKQAVSNGMAIEEGSEYEDFDKQEIRSTKSIVSSVPGQNTGQKIYENKLDTQNIHKETSVLDDLDEILMKIERAEMRSNNTLMKIT